MSRLKISVIISSFVGDVLMPPIGLLMGGVDFKDLSVVIQEAVGDAAAVTINYGAFIQTLVDFIIIAFADENFARYVIE